MDIRKHPPNIKPRRSKGTPARAFSRNISFVVIAAGLGYAVLQTFLPAGYAYKRKIEEGVFEDSKEFKISNLLFMSGVNRSYKIRQEREAEEQLRAQL